MPHDRDRRGHGTGAGDGSGGRCDGGEEVRITNNYSVRIEVKDGEVEEILKRLEEAQEEIYRCYQQLQDIGILSVVPNDKNK